jgi:hypothetical protein
MESTSRPLYRRSKHDPWKYWAADDVGFDHIDPTSKQYAVVVRFQSEEANLAVHSLTVQRPLIRYSATRSSRAIQGFPQNNLSSPSNHLFTNYYTVEIVSSNSETKKGHPYSATRG